MEIVAKILFINILQAKISEIQLQVPLIALVKAGPNYRLHNLGLCYFDPEPQI